MTIAAPGEASQEQHGRGGDEGRPSQQQVPFVYGPWGVAHHTVHDWHPQFDP
jgi:hypothetical protein